MPMPIAADWSATTTAQITNEHRSRLRDLQAYRMLETGDDVTLRDVLHDVIEAGLSTLQPTTTPTPSQPMVTNGAATGR